MSGAIQVIENAGGAVDMEAPVAVDDVAAAAAAAAAAASTAAAAAATAAAAASTAAAAAAAASGGQVEPRKHTFNWLLRYRYKKPEEQHVVDTRNILLIVSALIAAVTFQAGVNPPGGVWQDSLEGHVAGSAIYSEKKEAFYVFLVSNTLALSSAILVIVSLTYEFPFSVELWIGTMSMIVTYGSSVFAITPHDNYKFRYLLFTALMPVVIRGFVEVIRYVKRKYQKKNPNPEE